MAKNPRDSSPPASLTAEMEEVKKVFKKFDTNGDGKISLSELGGILNALGTKTTPDEAKRMMIEVDTDGDGFIDLKEFAAFHCPVESPNTVNKDLRDAFNLYDKDKNGKISAAELHSVMKGIGEKCSLKDCRRMISSVDDDCDGSVNFEEFKKMMSKA
uniref:Probable calcium-binding protein CML23 n=2 Tax=Nicotiana sylvestris TaxID=4096 RepID=A0A1U7W9L9_NICSY|nr:PREDICTED: probable calcium-binding protein CML23 [Nicotiana sylvestris]